MLFLTSYQYCRISVLSLCILLFSMTAEAYNCTYCGAELQILTDGNYYCDTCERNCDISSTSIVRVRGACKNKPVELQTPMPGRREVATIDSAGSTTGITSVVPQLENRSICKEDDDKEEEEAEPKRKPQQLAPMSGGGEAATAVSSDSGITLAECVYLCTSFGIDRDTIDLIFDECNLLQNEEAVGRVLSLIEIIGDVSKERIARGIVAIKMMKRLKAISERLLIDHFGETKNIDDIRRKKYNERLSIHAEMALSLPIGSSLTALEYVKHANLSSRIGSLLPEPACIEMSVFGIMAALETGQSLFALLVIPDNGGYLSVELYPQTSDYGVRTVSIYGGGDLMSFQWEYAGLALFSFIEQLGVKDIALLKIEKSTIDEDQQHQAAAL